MHSQLWFVVMTPRNVYVPLSPASQCCIADLLYPDLSKTPGRSSPVYFHNLATFCCNGLIQCFNAWCADVVASSLMTWPNSAWPLLLIISAMFDRPFLSAMSTFFTWFCHFTPSIWRWHDIWKDCNMHMSSASRVHVSAPMSDVCAMFYGAVIMTQPLWEFILLIWRM